MTRQETPALRVEVIRDGPNDPSSNPSDCSVRIIENNTKVPEVSPQKEMAGSRGRNSRGTKALN